MLCMFSRQNNVAAALKPFLRLARVANLSGCQWTLIMRQRIYTHVCLSFSDNSDLIACMVVSKDGGQAQRFLAVDVYQMSLVEPETKRLGWGVVKFAGLLQVREK